jgi:hypothetical protein
LMTLAIWPRAASSSDLFKPLFATWPNN